MAHVKQMRKGICESCDEQKEQNLTLEFGNIWLCPSCQATEAETIAQNAKHVVEFSKKVDTSITLKADIYNANTVAFVELQAAIEADSSIPTHRKSYEMMTRIAERVEKLSQVIFEEEAATAIKREERHALLVNAQQLVTKLHESERAKFKQYDVNYQPKKVVSPKAAAGKTRAKKPTFDKTALVNACQKYPGVPMAQVQSIILSRGWTAEAAAKHLAEIMGLV